MKAINLTDLLILVLISIYLLYMVLRYILHMYVKEKHFDSGYLVTWWIFARLPGIASNFARLYS